MNRLASPPSATHPTWPRIMLLFLLLLLGCTPLLSHALSQSHLSDLRLATRHLFYHGYTNYLTHAFPEDELRPLTCRPQTRNRDDPSDIGLNDVLGNYSLTLIDSLSTLAILAGGEEDGKNGHWALQDFQKGVISLVELYGDGREGSCGSRACGFDLDSKVQVFETNIRGLGGLLSAHLFATGDLPMRGYNAKPTQLEDGTNGIRWLEEGFVYKDQLLRLAHNLASRLLPAFSTPTGLPYPRVNLRHGIPFYSASPDGTCNVDGSSSEPREITETCAAGAGSLVLEFSVLSALTGDSRFEHVAKRAFWAVWERRSTIGLVGSGIDAESGFWTSPPLAGIGAGTDSFFEYALKSHILLSASITTTEEEAAEYLKVWQKSHEAISHHIRRSTLSEKHPYYSISDLHTGAPRYTWIDNLSAYYPGLLTLAGNLNEAIESHLLYSALWTRYSALPERWHASPQGGFIDGNFKHWAGRPEFVESTWYLYQATKDPWFLSVGEMVLRDVRRRCWVKCGWADLGDVVSGELRDRMESFFLGETAKYLYLLFDEEHPLNKLGEDGSAPLFSTEGHPLVIPKRLRKTERSGSRRNSTASTPAEPDNPWPPAATCPTAPPLLPFTISSVANRSDLFHAAAMTNLHLVPVNPARSSPLLDTSDTSPGVSLADVRSPTNYTFYPWTLPASYIPAMGVSGVIHMPVVSTLTFPNLHATGADGKEGEGGDQMPLGALQKVLEGVLINSLSNLRLNMVQQSAYHHSSGGAKGGGRFATHDAVALNRGDKGPPATEFRIQAIANWALGRDEKVLVSGEAIKQVSPTDPHFTRVKDLEWVDLVVDIPGTSEGNAPEELSINQQLEMLGQEAIANGNGTLESLWQDLEQMLAGLLSSNTGEKGGPQALLEPLQEQLAAAQVQQHERAATATPALTRGAIAAILPTGIGAAPLPASMDNTLDLLSLPLGSLPFSRIFFLDDPLCKHTLPLHIAKKYSILVLRRGECSFNAKLANIPVYPPDPGNSLELVVVVSYAYDVQSEKLIRPLLDERQMTPSGLVRREGLGMVLVDGSRGTVRALRGVAACEGSFDGRGRLVERDGVGGALAVKRRFWFESMGVPIANLVML